MTVTPPGPGRADRRRARLSRRGHAGGRHQEPAHALDGVWRRPRRLQVRRQRGRSCCTTGACCLAPCCRGRARGPRIWDTCCRPASRSWRGEPRDRARCWSWPRAPSGSAGTSIWVGDSLLARPRHEPLTLLAAVAARVPRVELGTAVLLPALRNPVLLAHQVATLDQIAEGRLILGVGIARDVPNIRAEFTAAGVPFEKRVGRMLEGLRPLPRAVERQAGRLGWPLEGRGRRAGADAASPGRAADLDRRLAAGEPGACRQAFRRLAAERARCGAAGASSGREVQAHRPRGRPRSRQRWPGPCT